MVRQNAPQVQHWIKNKPFLIAAVILALIFVTFLIIWLNLPWRPDITPFHSDSGFYAYFGKAILHGQIPYRDVWDDKPPLGYYLNALGLFIFGQNSWGVWWAGVVWILGCTVLTFVVIRKLFGSVPAWISSGILLAGLMNPELFEGVNLMEVYGLAPQIAIIGITYLFFTRQRKTWIVILLGIFTSIAYLIKPSTITLGCASILIMVVSLLSEWKIRDAIRISLAFVSGFIGLIAIVSLYWLWAGALDKFIDGIFLQGFFFIGGPESNFRFNYLNALTKVLPSMYFGKLYLIAILVGIIFLWGKLYQFWIRPVLAEGLSILDKLVVIVLIVFPLVAKYIWLKRNIGLFWLISIFAFGVLLLIKFYRLRSRPAAAQVFSPVEWTWLIAIVSLPIEVLMASLGGRYFGHYFITLLPATILAVAYPLWKIATITRETLRSKGQLLQAALYVILGISSIVWGVNAYIKDWPSQEVQTNLAGLFTGKVPLNELEQYIVQSTTPNDEVLVWHIHLGINFITDRRAPSRFLFPLNLFIPPTEQNRKLEEFVDDIEAHPPELIVVQRVSSMSLPFVDKPMDQQCVPFCTPEFAQALEIPQISQQWLRFQEFFETHYTVDNHIYDWIIYRKLH